VFSELTFLNARIAKHRRSANKRLGTKIMRYLSLDWIDAMQAQVAASESLTELAVTHSIGVTQVVTDGPEGSVLYHLQVGNGIARFASGPAPEEDVRMEQTWETAVGVSTGSMPAQEAFIKGHVRITGDTQRLMDAVPVFAALDAAFTAVRALTTYE
jgi:putative sterol carrier protein